MMKRIGIVAVFLAGCGVGGASSQLVVPKASAQQAAMLTKWEYLWTSASNGAVASQLSRAGAEGWELASIQTEGGLAFLCFKRPKL